MHRYHVSKRVFDLAICLVLLPLLMPFAVMIMILIRLDTPGPAIYVSSRVGRNGKRFHMLKFRTMTKDTPEVPTHLMHNAAQSVTAVGGFLRKTSLDEMPQIINVFAGDMSLVGPRPALTSQSDLLALRDQARVCCLLPGVTGWAQINGRDRLSIPDKVALEQHYLEHQSMRLDVAIIAMTLLKVLSQADVA